MFRVLSVYNFAYRPKSGGGDWTPFPPLAPGSDGPAEVVVMMTILAVEVLKFKDKLIMIFARKMWTVLGTAIMFCCLYFWDL